jgi:hypothetical protein
MPNAARAALTIAIGIVFAILVFAHVPGVNGPDYWQWAWQRRTDLPAVACCLAFAAAPAFFAQRVRSRAAGRGRRHLDAFGLRRGDDVMDGADDRR